MKLDKTNFKKCSFVTALKNGRYLQHSGKFLASLHYKTETGVFSVPRPRALCVTSDLRWFIHRTTTYTG